MCACIGMVVDGFLHVGAGWRVSLLRSVAMGPKHIVTITSMFVIQQYAGHTVKQAWVLEWVMGIFGPTRYTSMITKNIYYIYIYMCSVSMLAQGLLGNKWLPA